MRHIPLALALLAVLVAVSLRKTRWARASLWVSRLAFAGLVLQAPLYFLAKGGGRISFPNCEWTFGLALARHSLTNYGHIILFMIFFLLAYAQLTGVPRPIMWSVAATMAMGLLVELSQGVSGHGHCRMRDMIPNSVGALAGLAIISSGAMLSRYRRRLHAVRARQGDDTGITG